MENTKNETKWTPRPWYMTDAGFLINDDGQIVTGVEHRTRKLNEREAANLALITAAPDLYAALEDAEFLLRKVGTNWKEAASMKDSFLRSAEDARAALAKARGGAS